MGYPHFRKLHIMLILYNIYIWDTYIYIVEYIWDMGISHGTSQNYSGFLSRSMMAVPGNRFPAEKKQNDAWGMDFLGRWLIVVNSG